MSLEAPIQFTTSADTGIQERMYLNPNHEASLINTSICGNYSSTIDYSMNYKSFH